MSEVSVKVHAPGATIVMQQPETGNALSPSMVAALDQALDDLHQEGRVRYVIVAASGNQFSTGIDLKQLHQTRQQDDLAGLAALHEDWVRGAELLQKMLRFPKPLIAAVDGGAWGAGFALVLACDLVVASEQASFSAAATSHGLIGGLVAPLLVFRLGGAVASRMLLGREPLTATEAQSLGLLGGLASSDQIWVAAAALGQQATEGPREAIQLTKRLLNETIGETVSSHLTIGAGMGATACSTESAAEGLRAFAEKRPPVWP